MGTKAGVRPKRKRTAPDLKRKNSRDRQKLEGPKEPENERDRKFCERYLVHRNHVRAFREAGFAESSTINGGPAAKYQRFAAYLDKHLRAVDAVVVHQLAYERVDLLDAMAAIALANPQDFIEKYEVLLEDGTTEHRIGVRDLMSLPRHLAYAVEEFHCDPTTGVITYTMPSLNTKAKLLKILAENTGAIKRDDLGANHIHLHLKGVPTSVLEQAEAQLIATLGPEKVRALLGDIPHDGKDD